MGQKNWTLMLSWLVLWALFGCGGQKGEVVTTKDARADRVVVTSANMEVERLVLKNTDGNDVVVNLQMPRSKQGPVPVVIAMHGMTGSKQEWLVEGGYTKGGDVTRRLVESGVAVVSFDMAYHGEHYLHTEQTDYVEVVEGNRADFMEKSVVSFDTVLNYIKSESRFDGQKIAMMSYSLGGLVTFLVANQHPEIRAIACIVPPNQRDKNDAFEPLKHQSNLTDTAVLIVSATDDEYISYDDSVWMFEQLQMPNKEMLTYQSGHSLPIDYVVPVHSWFVKQLLQ